jgi:uncharacterized protein
MKKRFRCLALALCLVSAQAASAADMGGARASLKTMGVQPTVQRLVQYAAQGDATVVDLIVAAGVEVDAADPVHGATALHHAAAQGHTRVVMQLLGLGARVNVKDRHGATPLTSAAYFGRTETVGALLANGALPNVQGVPVTPLMAAVLSGKAEVVDRLVAAGADPRQPSSGGLTVAAIARTSGREALMRGGARVPGHAAEASKAGGEDGSDVR